MKTLFRLMAIFALLLTTASCGDDEVVSDKLPSLDVNYANVAGTWKLTNWNGDELNEPRYYYITFDRKEENGKRKYTVYTNLNSAVSERITGTFLLDNEEEVGDLIDGTYDYTLSTEDGWEHSYIVTELNIESMSWKAKDDAEEVRVYTRCTEVPADIVSGTRAVK